MDVSETEILVSAQVNYIRSEFILPVPRLEAHDDHTRLEVISFKSITHGRGFGRSCRRMTFVWIRRCGVSAFVSRLDGLESASFATHSHLSRFGIFDKRAVGTSKCRSQLYHVRVPAISSSRSQVQG